MVDTNGNDWMRWSKHVLLEIERLNNGQESIRKEIELLKIESVRTRTQLEVRAGMVATGVSIGIASLGFIIQYLI